MCNMTQHVVISNLGCPVNSSGPCSIIYLTGMQEFNSAHCVLYRKVHSELLWEDFMISDKTNIACLKGFLFAISERMIESTTVFRC